MRFNALSAEILLHRQAEIVALRDELWECQKNDNSAAKGTNRSERPSAVGDIPGTKRQIKGISRGLGRTQTDELADLVNMEPSSPDGFTNRWSLGFLYYYDKVIGHRIHATDEAEHSRNAIVYQNQRIMAFARTFKTIVACIYLQRHGRILCSSGGVRWNNKLKGPAGSRSASGVAFAKEAFLLHFRDLANISILWYILAQIL
ncbi:hypothetical protein HYQ46_012590 [Verticillium longisporum]|nr:hypothetical protein HYQ44_002256 [Verticillium longisporum]KAG7151622.1 hypothetical protein HYQ46_012590 [Verticillium longisporum]